MLTSGIRPDDEPPLHELDEYAFQNLCCDIFRVEPNIATCDVYGTRGQRQYGIDLLARRKNGDGIEVGQCKCYKEFSVKDIQEVSDDFFAHWGRWSTENTKKFVLFVACGLSQRQQQDEISEQTKRFKTIGVIYEAWSVSNIVSKLRPYREIVSKHIPIEYWVNRICGEPHRKYPTNSGIEVQISAVVQESLVSQFEKLTKHFSTDTEKQLEGMRANWQEGRENEVIGWLHQTKNTNDVWVMLSPQVKAMILRFEAGIELDSGGNIARAKQLADEALTFLPSDSQARLRASIALRENNPELALRILAEQDDQDSRNMRAGILLQMGRVAESLEILTLEEDSSATNG
jgi:hypothetical protein